MTLEFFAFVKRTITRFCEGSITVSVPVHPVCPTVSLEASPENAHL